MSAQGLKIADGFSLPIEAGTLAHGVLGQRGSGKSHTCAVIAEAMLDAGHQVVAIDPTGAWWGLRSSADGKGAGYPIAVLGGEHGDVVLDEHAGETVAAAITAERFSCVIDLSLFRKGQIHRFMTAFLSTIYRLNREPMHLFIDEADIVAPQRCTGDVARLLGAAEDVVRRGRRRGIGVTLITQRPQVLAKDVLTQCEILTTLRLGHPKDLGAVREWIEVHASAASAKEMMASLPSLPTGTAWVWSPALGIHERVMIRHRTTFDSGATPKPGQTVKAPRVLAPVDVAKLGAAIAETAQRAKENDPRALRAELDQARRRIAELEARPSKSERVEVPVVMDYEIKTLREVADQLVAATAPVTAQVDQLRHLIAAATAPAARAPTAAASSTAAARSRSAPAPRSSAPLVAAGPGSPEVGTGGLRRILVALAQRPAGLTASQIGLRAQLSSKSGTFDTYLSRARATGWIAGDRSRVTITEQGLAALGTYEPLPTGRELLAHYLRELGTSGAARMLEAIARAYPKALSRAEVADAAGLTGSSGTFDTYLSRLRSLELIEGRSELRLSEELT